jgi:hypothetical protein
MQIKKHILVYWLYSLVPLLAVAIWYPVLAMSGSYYLSSLSFWITMISGFWLLAYWLGFRKSERSFSSSLPIGIFDAIMLVIVVCVFPLWTMFHGILILLSIIGFLYFYHPRLGKRMKTTNV